MTAHDPALVERVARAMFMARYVVGDQRINDRLWDRTSPMMREDCRQDVLAVLDAITETHAVIELPEPNSTRYDEGDEDEAVDRLGWWQPGSEYGVTQWGYPNEVQFAYQNEPCEPLTVDEARFLAAALLAAARAAEDSQ